MISANRSGSDFFVSLAFISVKEDVSTFQPNIALDRHCNGPLLFV
jgi:hypothetical protein